MLGAGPKRTAPASPGRPQAQHDKQAEKRRSLAAKQRQQQRLRNRMCSGTAAAEEEEGLQASTAGCQCAGPSAAAATAVVGAHLEQVQGLLLANLLEVDLHIGLSAHTHSGVACGHRVGEPRSRGRPLPVEPGPRVRLGRQSEACPAFCNGILVAPATAHRLLQPSRRPLSSNPGGAAAIYPLAAGHTPAPAAAQTTAVSADKGTCRAFCWGARTARGGPSAAQQTTMVPNSSREARPPGVWGRCPSFHLALAATCALGPLRPGHLTS